MSLEVKRRLWPKIRDPLNRLDQVAGKVLMAMPSTLYGLDRWVKGQCREIKTYIIHGGSKGYIKTRTGNRFLDFLSSLKYDFCRVLDWLDTVTFFRGRKYQAKECRVRSKAEKRIANYFTDNGIKFRYEKPLRLGRVLLHPDFYLKRYNVYVEYWGLAESKGDYDRNHRHKLSLYKKHKIPVISVYPCDFGNLEQIFPRLFKEVTGKNFPSQRKEK